MQPIFSSTSTSSRPPGSGDRGYRLAQTIRAWEEDPKRWQKLQWRGLDNSDKEEESNEESDSSSESSRDDVGSYQGVNISDDDFVVDDMVDGEDQNGSRDRDSVMSEMVALAPPAPLPQVVPIANVTLPCMTASDCIAVPESEQTCIVCSEHSCSVVLVPCGHATTCLHCLYELFKVAHNSGTRAKCPGCRQQVAQVIRLYRN